MPKHPRDSQGPETEEQLRRRERNRRYYAQRRAAAAVQRPVPTTAQLQQGERIVDLSFTDEDAAVTLTQLGLRVQGLTLPQDAGDAHLQEQAVHVDEHDSLYDDEGPIMADASTRAPTPASTRQPGLARFFHTLPPRNPFATPASQSHRGQAAPSPAPPPIPSLRPSAVIQGSEDVMFGDSDRNEDTEDEEDEAIPGPENRLNHEAEHEVVVGDGAGLQGEAEGPIWGEEDNTADPGNGSGEEESVYSFESERSAGGGDEDDHEDDSATRYTAGRLFDQLQGGFNGCSAEEHQEQRREHNTAVHNNHHGLNDLFNEPTFPSVLALSEMISADRLAQQPVPSPAQWQAMFCGLLPHRPHRVRPLHVCLHQEETQAVEPQVRFDVDSFLGFASSLAMARKGLWYQPAPQMRQNMTNDVHLETRIFRDGAEPEHVPRSTLALLRDVPHFLLGRVVGFHDMIVHILFPHLVSAQDKFTSLTKEQLARWLDRVFHPAVYQYCEANYTQHLPASHRNALADSKAHQVEGRKIETASYQAQQSIGYHLQPEDLDDIWTTILDTINTTPGLCDFREPQLFFSAKGTKLQFKTRASRPTMLDAMGFFQSYLEDIIDLDLVFLDRFYVDLGKEICPHVSLLESQVCHVGEEAQVYQWRRCCLRHYIREMYDGQPPAEGHDGQRYFDQNMLHDAASLTSVTPKQSKLRRGGLIYTQMYGSVKEISDATKCMPFDNDGLEELALDPQIRQGARHVAGGHRRDAKILERAYCASKRRTRDALIDSRKKSFGIREEHRISWALFQALVRRLRLEAREVLEIVLHDCPSYVWAIKTEVYLNFLWRSADKFATGFEVVRARCRAELVTWEQTKMMATFLRCLRFVFGGHLLRRESALWWSRRERPTRVWYGLGFCNTLPRYKYCWLEPRIDWNQLTFKSNITDEVLFGNNMLRDQYLRRGGQVRDFFDATRQLELALEWMDRHHGNDTIRDRLIFWTVHICLQQFRVDILSSVKAEISDEHREEALQGLRPFCVDYFEEIMAGGVYLISGNRCDFKQASHLGHFLFDFDDGRIRSHWEDRPYRKLYRRARTALSLRHDALGLVRTFSRRFWRSLYTYHWILPYPCAEVLMQTTKQGQRMWYSIQPEATAPEPFELLDPSQWQWARKSWRAGPPPVLPRYLSWCKEEWQGWMDRHEGGAGTV